MTSWNISLKATKSVVTKTSRGAGTKICSNCPGRITNMATTPIYVKTIKSRTNWPMALTIRMYSSNGYREYSDDDLRLILTFFTARSKMGKCPNIKFHGTYSNFGLKLVYLVNFMRIWRCLSTKGQGHFLLLTQDFHSMIVLNMSSEARCNQICLLGMRDQNIQTVQVTWQTWWPCQ